MILVSTLSIEHWDNFFKEIAGFLERLKIPEAEKVYEKGQESAELYVERYSSHHQFVLFFLQ